MPVFHDLEVQRSRRGLTVTGKFSRGSPTVPVGFYFGLQKSWLVAETAGSSEGKVFMDWVEDILGKPSDPPTLVKGGACDEGEGDEATGSTLTATWAFTSENKVDVTETLSRELGVDLEPG
jgi:hypothetical protein